MVIRRKRKSSNPSRSSSPSKKPRDYTFANLFLQVDHFRHVGELPGEYEWKIWDMCSDEGANEVYNLMKNKLVHDELSQLKDEYTKGFLQWALHSPGFEKKWHLGVEEKSTKDLVGFIGAVPAFIRVLDREMWVAEVKFIFVHEKLRSQGLGPILIKEMAKMVQFHVIYATPDNVPLPVAACRCYTRPLNLKKLIDIGFYKLGENMTVEKEVEIINSLPASYPINGLREMEAKDVPLITSLLQSYLSRFFVAAIFSEGEVDYWFSPREDIVDSYVVESENGEITDFFSFYIVPFSVLEVNDTTLRSANMFYNVSTTTQVSELLTAAMVIAKSKGLDTFRVLDIMENKASLLEDLKFDGGLCQHYYLHSYSPRAEYISPRVGLVMF